MQSSDNVVSRIVDLDTLAESIRMRAREEAENIRAGAQRRLAEEKAQLEQRISERSAQVEASALNKRNGEIDAVRREYADQAKKVGNVPSDRMARVVDLVISRIKGTAE